MEAILLGGAGHLHLCYVNRGMCWSKLGISKALADFTEAKRIKPGATEANLQRSLLFAEKGDHMSHLVDLDDGCILE